MDNKLKILNWLGKHYKERYTMHQLSKLIKIPYATFYREIQEMKELLANETIGRSKTIQLKLQNELLKSYLTIASGEERKEYLKKQPVIKNILQEIKTGNLALLFGSFAENKQTKKSDVDIMIVNKDGRKEFSFTKYELLFKRNINPIYLSEKEFKMMLKEREENVVKQALKNHIILKNPEKFWKYVLDVIR